MKNGISIPEHQLTVRVTRHLIIFLPVSLKSGLGSSSYGIDDKSFSPGICEANGTPCASFLLVGSGA